MMVRPFRTGASLDSTSGDDLAHHPDLGCGNLIT